MHPPGRLRRREPHDAWEHRFDDLYLAVLGDATARDDALGIRTGLFPLSGTLFWVHSAALKREMGLSKAQLNKRLMRMSTVLLHPGGDGDAQARLFVALSAAPALPGQRPVLRDWVLRTRNAAVALPPQNGELQFPTAAQETVRLADVPSAGP
jgi:hypothetical protein